MLCSAPFFRQLWYATDHSLSRMRCKSSFFVSTLVGLIFFQSIRDDVEWMGWKPAATTYSSERFGTLYEMAVKLIKVRRVSFIM